MRDHLFAGLQRLGSRRSLSSRGYFLNTFAGIGFSVAFSLLALGGYLMDQQFANPMQAQAVGLVIAALLVSTAITLLYCLVHPSRRWRHRTGYWAATNASLEDKTLVVVRSTSPGPPNPNNTPLQRRYVDRTRINVQR
jgi:hypothetical protein